MSRGLGNRIRRLETRQVVGAGHESFARERARQERIRELAKEDPEGYTAYLDAEDEVLIAIEEARARSEITGEDPEDARARSEITGEDPEDAPEVWEAHRALERAEQRLLGEDAAGPI